MSDIKQRADEYARKNKNCIAKAVTSKFRPDTPPVSVFMAGSPGAGKTESSKILINEFKKDNHMVLRIDPDELRSEFSDYTGSNSNLFIGATSILADRIHDIALKRNLSFIFDGTLSNLNRARQNIQRSLNKERSVLIVYVYQDPLQAWKFVKIRETKDGRRIPRESFVKQYFMARANVNLLKMEFKNTVKVDLIIKNADGTNLRYHRNIWIIDNHMPEKYTKYELENLIKN